MLETNIWTTNSMDERLVLFPILSLSVHIAFIDNICYNHCAIDCLADSKYRVYRVRILQAPVRAVKSCGKSRPFVENRESLLLGEKSAHAIGHLDINWWVKLKYISSRILGLRKAITMSSNKLPFLWKWQRICLSDCLSELQTRPAKFGQLLSLNNDSIEMFTWISQWN